jgi:hypothetical protein
MDSILLTNSNAGAETETTIAAVCYVYTGENSTPAILNADILSLVVCNLTAALAADESDIPFNIFRDCAHNGGYLFCNRRAAYRAAVYRSITGSNGTCHGVTACETTGTAVVTGQTLTYSGFPLVHIYVELLTGINEGNTDDNSD